MVLGGPPDPVKTAKTGPRGLRRFQFLSYKKKDVPGSKAKKPKKEWDVPKSRWRALGFHQSMSIEESRTRASQLNAQEMLKRQEERIRKMEIDRRQELLRAGSMLPLEFVAEFEERFLRPRDRDSWERRRSSRARVIWSAAQRLITTLQIEPSDWFYCHPEIYDYFCQQEYSLRYVYSILKFANLWGYFISRKLARPFLPVPLPRGHDRQRLLDTYYRKSARVRRPSAPLTPGMLAHASQQLNQPNFNWLHISVWLGLRPQEIDNLQNREMWRLEILPNGRQVIWVYQTKIIAVPPEDRWKPIPLLYDEQRFALRMIEAGAFRRPIVRTVHRYFGPRVDLYGGRKGFSDLMLSKGQLLENISVWMGHSTLERTWRSYKNKKIFHLR